jgi:hypothetical protein
MRPRYLYFTTNSAPPPQVPVRHRRVRSLLLAGAGQRTQPHSFGDLGDEAEQIARAIKRPGSATRDDAKVVLVSRKDQTLIDCACGLVPKDNCGADRSMRSHAHDCDGSAGDEAFDYGAWGEILQKHCRQVILGVRPIIVASRVMTNTSAFAIPIPDGNGRGSLTTVAQWRLCACWWRLVSRSQAKA